MDSRILIQLYQDIIRRYPFSITGRPDPEKALADFFATFCRHPIIKERENILFIIALFAELQSLGLDTYSLERVANWQTKPLKDLLLFNYEGEYPDLVLSFYLALLRRVSGGKDVTATNIIADNVISDVDLRVKVTPFDEPSIHFIEREDVIEFRTPKKIFNEEFWDEERGCLRTGQVRRLLQSYLTGERPEENLIARSRRGDPHVFTIDRRENNVFERDDESGVSAIYTLLNKSALDATVAAYFDEFARLSRRVLKGRLRDGERSKDFTWIAIGGAFLAAYYDINLDYVLSVCNVSSKEYLTLGGLAVGSRRRAPLSMAERALFSIVSDHISANLSAQMAHDLFSVQFMKGKAKYILQNFATSSPEKDLWHVMQPGENTKELARSALRKFRRAKVARVISSASKKHMMSYLTKLTEEGGDFRQVREGYESAKKCMEFSARDLWDDLNVRGDKYRESGVEFILEPSRNEFGRTRLYGDYRWILKVVDVALGNLTPEVDRAFDRRHFEGSARVEVKVYFSGEQNTRLTKPAEGFVLRCVIEDNGIGCNVADVLAGGGYRSFFGGGETAGQSDKEVLNAHGNITIESRGLKLDFLRPKEKILSDFGASGEHEGTRVTLHLDCYIQ